MYDGSTTKRGKVYKKSLKQQGEINMEKYFELLNNAAELIARKAAQGTAIVIDLKRIESLLSAAELKIETAEKAG